MEYFFHSLFLTYCAVAVGADVAAAVGPDDALVAAVGYVEAEGVRCSSRAWPSHCCLHCYYWTTMPRMRSLTCWSRNLMNSGSPLCS